MPASLGKRQNSAPELFEVQERERPAKRIPGEVASTAARLLGETRQAAIEISIQADHQGRLHAI
jgi:hypothetical protein